MPFLRTIPPAQRKAPFSPPNPPLLILALGGGFNQDIRFSRTSPPPWHVGWFGRFICPCAQITSQRLLSKTCIYGKTPHTPPFGAHKWVLNPQFDPL